MEESELASLLQQIATDRLTKQVAYVNCISTRVAAERIWSRLPKNPAGTLEEGSAIFDRVCKSMMGEPLEEREDIADVLSRCAPIFETAYYLGMDSVEFAGQVLHCVGPRNGRDPHTFVRDCHKWALDYKAAQKIAVG